jgi:tetratricopeptide (TPR) repeat protein
MDERGPEKELRAKERTPIQSEPELSSDVLARVQELYDACLCKQAYEVGENPGNAWSWQRLTDWLVQNGQHEEALAAITNVRRLEPLNPLPLGYRATMKLRNGDRAGAKADLDQALQYDPGYSFASLSLFDLQLTGSSHDRSIGDVRTAPWHDRR